MSELTERILNELRSLSEEDRKDLIREVALDENLMRMLLDELIALGASDIDDEIPEAKSFVDFLKKVKE